jgi:hypothetical protein
MYHGSAADHSKQNGQSYVLSWGISLFWGRAAVIFFNNKQRIAHGISGINE